MTQEERDLGDQLYQERRHKDLEANRSRFLLGAYHKVIPLDDASDWHIPTRHPLCGDYQATENSEVTVISQSTRGESFRKNPQRNKQKQQQRLRKPL